MQRYEIEDHLPIHRTTRGSVFANKAELDRWINGANARQTRSSAERTNRARADFLLIDSEIALTFSGMALQDDNKEKRRRRTQAAREAFDTIMRMSKDVCLDDVQKGKLDANLGRLKSDLESLGQRF